MSTQVVPANYGRQMKNLDDAQTFEHPSFTKTQVVLTGAVRNANIVALFGEAGTGKTYATHHFVQRLNQKAPGIRTAWVEIPHQPRGKDLPYMILQELYGQTNNRLTTSQMLDDASQGLADQQTVLVIDEAHHLRTDGLFQVKYLYDAANFRLGDHGRMPLTIVLVGGKDLPRILQRDEQLDSRVAPRVPFARLEGDELLDALVDFHEVLANTDEALLDEIDQRACHGSLRRWALALQTVLTPLHGDTPTRIERDLAEVIIDLIGTGTH